MNWLCVLEDATKCAADAIGAEIEEAGKQQLLWSDMRDVLRIPMLKLCKHV